MFIQICYQTIYENKKTMAESLGPLEIKLLAYVQGRTSPTLASGECAVALGWSQAQERGVLSRLSKNGLIVRVRPGLYLVPSRLPPGGRYSPGEFLVLDTLMKDRDGRYQISGPNAFHRYGWTDQVPNRLYVYNNRISGERMIGPVALTLIKTPDARLGGVDIVRAPDGIAVVHASRARALVDAVHDWSRFDTLPRAFAWIAREVEQDDAFAAKLVEDTIRFGNQGTIRRIGAWLERLDAPAQLVRRLERGIRPSMTFIPWIPNREKRGKTDKRWGVVINGDPLDE